MKISRTIAYAVQAVLQLSSATPGVPIPCGRLAADGSMPERFLLQVLRNLVRSEILRSVRGAEGGYLLAKDPAEVTLLDILEAFNVSLMPSVPSLEGLPAEAQAKMLEAMNHIAAAAKQELAAVTIADLASHHDLDEGE